MSVDINYVAPGPVTSAFIASRRRRSLICGPFGSGKTGAAIARVLQYCFAIQQPGNGESGPGIRYSRFAVVRNTSRQLNDTTLKSWFQWVPNGSIGHYKVTEKTFHIRVGDVRAEIMFRALDDADDVKNLLSAEYSCAWMNECREIDPEIARALDGRIGRYPSVKDGGTTLPLMWGDTNPPEEDSYWYYVMEGLDPETQLPYSDPRLDPNWEVFVQPSGLAHDAENVQNLLGGQDYYRNLMQGKTKNFVNMYVHGRYGRSVDEPLVHPLFDPEFHISKERLYPNPHQTVVIACDFGSTPAMVFKQQDYFGRVLNLDEVTTTSGGLQKAIEERMIPLINNRYVGCRFVVTGDPAGKVPVQTNAGTCTHIFQNFGFRTVEYAPTNAPLARREATDHFLGRRSEIGSMYLIDAAGCPTLTRGMRSGFKYPYNKRTMVRGENPVKNHFSHVCEAGEYGDMLIKAGVGHGDRLTRPTITQSGQNPGPGAYALSRR